MADLSPFVAPVAFLHGAALAGMLGARVIRARTWRARRTCSLAEAVWSVFFPVVCVFLLPALALLPVGEAGLVRSLHGMWHEWADGIQGWPAAHAALHAGNLLLIGVAAGSVVRTVYRLARMRAFTRALRALPRAEVRETDAGTVHLLSTARPFCFTTGTLRPAIYLSTGLAESLSERDLAAMLAHEAAHIRRREALTGAFLALFYTLFPLPGSHRLLRDWERTAERACDAEAARRIGSSHDVATALVRVARLVAQGPALPQGACFTARPGDVEGRVRALLGEEPAPGHAGTRVVIAGGIAVSLVSGAGLPHLVELFTRH